MTTRWLAALPVYNEAGSVNEVLDQVVQHAQNVVVVNDGSTDGTAEQLQTRNDIITLTHPQNRGYGAALNTAFQYAMDNDFEVIVTLDCDGQHEPQRIPRFVSAATTADIVSGSRYLKTYPGDSAPPAQRLFVNRTITRQLNQLLGLQLTDAFCGFKAYRVDALRSLNVTEFGYAMPLQLWVQAAMRRMNIIEIPVPLIYLDLSRSFGGQLDQAEVRLKYYNEVIERSVREMQALGFSLPESKPASCQECP
ncbi:MAG: glycosyltransferase family 2 protein [Planctomycetaceae bacterium]|nr:glycosyltransferase family 2 protein [Planctomycetaceae bacterium]MBN8603918.1 glycosyltransferase family 2 protein [Planctomycetota bacterium]